MNGFVAALALAGLVGAQEVPDRDLPVSVSRILAALQREGLRITIPDRKPDFHVTISDIRLTGFVGGTLNWDDEPHRAQPPWWFTQGLHGAPGGSPPLIGIDLMPISRAIGKAVGDARRGRTERQAQEEVRTSLIEFCAVNDCDTLR
jgi:hypothetical protein